MLLNLNDYNQYTNRSQTIKEVFTAWNTFPMQIELKTALYNMNIRDGSDTRIKQILIPKDHARCEGNGPKNLEELSKYKGEFYTLYIFDQPGSFLNSRGTIVMWKLPSPSKLLVGIQIYRDGGADFMKSAHKDILRNTDELDRRIVRGFCQKYHMAISSAAHDKEVFERYTGALQSYALDYTYNDMPKRLKNGPGTFYSGRLRNWVYNPKIDESTLLSSIQLI